MENNNKKTKVDTVPPTYKKHFFPGVEMPNLSKDYDCIGFDADHCLVKYNIKTLNNVLAKIHLRDLHEYSGFPEEVMEFNTDEDSEAMRSCLNFSLFDIDNGTLLKLGEGNEVLAGQKGMQVLKYDEICALYGSPVPKFEHVKFPFLHSFPETEGPNYTTLCTYFDTVKVPAIMKAIQLIDEGKVDKTYQQFSVDYRSAIWRQYIHKGKNGEVLKASTYGWYFPEAFKDPTKFMIPQPELVPVFKQLRKQGKFIFLATNSHWEYMELIMKTTLGEDWRSCFDMVIANALKPVFFKEEQPFYLVDQSKSDMKGQKIESADYISNDNSLTYLEGSAKLLEDLMVNKGIVNPKCCYFGDQYTGDIHWSSQREKWDSIAVIEELSMHEEYKAIEEASPFAPMDLRLPNYAKHWGDDFMIHSEESPKKNLFTHHACQSARYAVPLVRHITNMIDE